MSPDAVPDREPGQDRERDAAGRPHNARPRDALGRPLPRGTPGVVGVPEDLVLSPQEALVEAQRLLDQGRPFHAHEVLEATWKAAPEAERDLWQGLAQLAVGLTHALRGNNSGAVSVLRRACDHISGYANQPPYNIDVTGLLEWAGPVVDRLDDPSKNSETPSTPRLCST
ncbi:MAG: uncharacterized protein QOF35_1721 [Actinomycetota bacterium]|jgi:hypothetical protein|nr:uncharacterized protein [Actinomycetota bacterium]